MADALAPVLAQPGGPLWWLSRLGAQLLARRKRIALYDAYYRGDHNLVFATPRYLEAFGGLFREFASNFCDLVVDAKNERLYVEGFRMGAAAERADADAQRFWQVNALDLHSTLGHLEAMIGEESAAIGWYGDDDTPDITFEDPTQVIVAMKPGSHRERAAAIKVWTDEVTGHSFATVYLPDHLCRLEQPNSVLSFPLLDDKTLSLDTALSMAAWRPREDLGDDWRIRNPLGVVPVVPFKNKQRLVGRSSSELKTAIGVQNAINKTLLDALVTSEFAAFPARYAIGLQLEDDSDGNPQVPLSMAVDRLLVNENSDGKFGSLPAADLRQYVDMVREFIMQLSTQSRTPSYYFYNGSGQFPSGDALRAANAGLYASVMFKQRCWGESHEELIRLAFACTNSADLQAKARIPDIETIWRDAEDKSEAAHADALTKLEALGVPQQLLWERAGLSQAEIARVPELLREQAKLAAELAALQPAAPANTMPGLVIPGAPAQAETVGAKTRL